MTININEITPKQKLTIAKGLCDYQYIMDYWKTNDEDFKGVFLWKKHETRVSMLFNFIIIVESIFYLGDYFL